jgi:hypothetical protein
MSLTKYQVRELLEYIDYMIQSRNLDKNNILDDSRRMWITNVLTEEEHEIQ